MVPVGQKAPNWASCCLEYLLTQLSNTVGANFEHASQAELVADKFTVKFVEAYLGGCSVYSDFVSL